MLKQGADPNTCDPGDDAYPIHYSVHHGPEMVQLLVDHGADVNIMARGWMPLGVAEAKEYTEVAAILRKAGAKPRPDDQEFTMDPRSMEQIQPRIVHLVWQTRVQFPTESPEKIADMVLPLVCQFAPSIPKARQDQLRQELRTLILRQCGVTEKARRQAQPEESPAVPRETPMSESEPSSAEMSTSAADAEGSGTADLNEPGLKAQDSMDRGDYASAYETLTRGLEKLPSTKECRSKGGAEAAARFMWLLLLAEVVKKWKRDAHEEFSLLDECVLLAHCCPPDLLYEVHMNRGVAAYKLGKFQVYEEAMVEAYAAAREEWAKCKSLAYRGWAIILQRDKEKLSLARESFDAFDQEAQKCSIDPILRAQVLALQAIPCLQDDDLDGARSHLLKAVQTHPKSGIAKKLLDIVRRPGMTAARALEDYWVVGDVDGKQDFDSTAGQLSPLPLKGLGLGAQEAGSAFAFATTDPVSDDEYHSLNVKLRAMRSPEEVERFSRSILETRSMTDVQRCHLLSGIARSLLRQGRKYDALGTAEEAIFLAHKANDAATLAMMLDTRAEILCRQGRRAESLRTLLIAEDYLAAARLENDYLFGWLAHSWGMVYLECGWWERAATKLRQAIEIMDHLRLPEDRARARSEFVEMVVLQAESEGADPELVEEAIKLTEEAERVFAALGDHASVVSCQLKRVIILNGYIAEAGRDLTRIRNNLADSVKLIELSIRGQLKGLDPESGVIERCVKHYLRMVIIWLELSSSQLEGLVMAKQAGDILNLDACKAMQLCAESAGLQRALATYLQADTGKAVTRSATLLERRVLAFLEAGPKEPPSEIRAGWLRSSKALLEGLAATAALACSKVRIPRSETVARMINLAQNLRARSHFELVRSSAAMTSDSTLRKEIEEDLQRIRCLRDRLDALKPPDRDYEGMSISPFLSEHEQSVQASMIKRYPEYKGLNTFQEVEEELASIKRRFSEQALHQSYRQPYLSVVEEAEPFDIEALRGELSDEDGILDFYVGSRQHHVALITQSRLDVFRLRIDSTNEFHRVMREKLKFKSFESKDDKSKLMDAMRSCSKWLFPNALVKSMEKSSIRRLYIVASGWLWRVPFPWLAAGNQLLCERWQTCIVPSMHLMPHKVVFTKPERWFAVGFDVPHMKGEAKLVEQVFRGQGILGHCATPSRLLKVLSQADLVHIACHGKCDDVDPLLSSLRLAPDPKHPDGHLELGELLGESLSASLVGLAACETARSDGPAAFAESLAHAFLAAEVPFVWASLWEAQHNECLRFSKHFYGQLAQGSHPIAAFQQTQLYCLERLRDDTGSALRGEGLTRLANFVLIGGDSTKKQN